MTLYGNRTANEFSRIVNLFPAILPEMTRGSIAMGSNIDYFTNAFVFYQINMYMYMYMVS